MGQLTPDHPVGLVGGLLLRGDQVLLGRRAAHKSFGGCWDLIGGHVEPGETPWVALARELIEEIGVAPQAGSRVATLPLEDRGQVIALLHVFFVSAWNGEPAIANDEHCELRWFTLNEARQLPNLALADYVRLFKS